MSFVYLDIEGNEHGRKEWDMHHPYNRGAMKGRGEKEWADMFTLPMLKVWHNLGKNALHSCIPLCPKPNKELMCLLRQNRYQQIEADKVAVAQGLQPATPYDNFIDMNLYVHQIAETTENSGLQRVAWRVANNLEMQSEFILLGQIERVEV